MIPCLCLLSVDMRIIGGFARAHQLTTSMVDVDIVAACSCVAFNYLDPPTTGPGWICLNLISIISNY